MCHFGKQCCSKSEVPSTLPLVIQTDPISQITTLVIVSTSFTQQSVGPKWGWRNWWSLFFFSLFFWHWVEPILVAWRCLQKFISLSISSFKYVALLDDLGAGGHETEVKVDSKSFWARTNCWWHAGDFRMKSQSKVKCVLPRQEPRWIPTEAALDVRMRWLISSATRPMLWGTSRERKTGLIPGSTYWVKPPPQMLLILLIDKCVSGKKKSKANMTTATLSVLAQVLKMKF